MACARQTCEARTRSETKLRDVDLLLRIQFGRPLRIPSARSDEASHARGSRSTMRTHRQQRGNFAKPPTFPSPFPRGLLGSRSRSGCPPRDLPAHARHRRRRRRGVRGRCHHLRVCRRRPNTLGISLGVRCLRLGHGALPLRAEEELGEVRLLLFIVGKLHPIVVRHMGHLYLGGSQEPMPQLGHRRPMPRRAVRPVEVRGTVGLQRHAALHQRAPRLRLVPIRMHLLLFFEDTSEIQQIRPDLDLGGVPPADVIRNLADVVRECRLGPRLRRRRGFPDGEKPARGKFPEVVELDAKVADSNGHFERFHLEDGLVRKVLRAEELVYEPSAELHRRLRKVGQCQQRVRSTLPGQRSPISFQAQSYDQLLEQSWLPQIESVQFIQQRGQVCSVQGIQALTASYEFEHRTKHRGDAPTQAARRPKQCQQLLRTQLGHPCRQRPLERCCQPLRKHLQRPEARAKAHKHARWQSCDLRLELVGQSPGHHMQPSAQLARRTDQVYQICGVQPFHRPLGTDAVPNGRRESVLRLAELRGIARKGHHGEQRQAVQFRRIREPSPTRAKHMPQGSTGGATLATFSSGNGSTAPLPCRVR
mmetsp:Transcript_75622/g.245880  ORF Transcript_75622/g.245880 Transcript_75622/m.245880 type:complete len:590 (+) Transcript_75622:411-2180(+)